MQIISPAFATGAAIPDKYTCKGQNISIPLDFSNMPETTKSLSLIMHDPDAPIPGGFTHWVIYDLPATTKSLAENSTPPGAQGLNGRGNAGYTGPCPPSGTHRYYFYLYALDTSLNFIKAPIKTELEAAMQGHVLAQAQTMGTFAH